MAVRQHLVGMFLACLHQVTFGTTSAPSIGERVWCYRCATYQEVGGEVVPEPEPENPEQLTLAIDLTSLRA